MERTEIIGILLFKKWVGEKGEIFDTSRHGVGYDFKVKWNDTGIEETFEVKGTTKIMKIPDISIREFDSDKNLKADYLFVAGNLSNPGQEIIYVIPRKALTNENLKLKQTYHIRLFQNKKKMGQYQI